MRKQLIVLCFSSHIITVISTEKKDLPRSKSLSTFVGSIPHLSCKQDVQKAGLKRWDGISNLSDKSLYEKIQKK